MGTIFRRAIVPVFLCLGAVASMIYGAVRHQVPVGEEQEIEVDFPMPAGFQGLPSFDEPSPPKIKEKVVVTADQSERTLIQAVTVGEMLLEKTGELRRTKGMGLCPS